MQTLPRTYSLASCYENAITIILRICSLQQSGPTSQEFRASIRAALKAAMEQAKAMGYSSEVNQFAFFAVVALLDESILKMQNPAFADWRERPFCLEIFLHNRAGEVFFDHLHTILVSQDSAETADCLEVFCLCMLLGFNGKYAQSITSLSGQLGSSGNSPSRPSGEILSLVRHARDKIERIRGAVSFFPSVALHEVKQAATIDPWSRRLGIAAIALFVLAVLAYGGFLIALSSGASQLG